MDKRLEYVRWRLPEITSTLDAIVADVVDEACAAAEMAVIDAEGVILATEALGRRAFTEHSPVLNDVIFQALVEDV